MTSTTKRTTGISTKSCAALAMLLSVLLGAPPGARGDVLSADSYTCSPNQIAPGEGPVKTLVLLVALPVAGRTGDPFPQARTADLISGSSPSSYTNLLLAHSGGQITPGPILYSSYWYPMPSSMNYYCSTLDAQGKGVECNWERITADIMYRVFDDPGLGLSVATSPQTIVLIDGLSTLQEPHLTINTPLPLGSHLRNLGSHAASNGREKVFKRVFEYVNADPDTITSPIFEIISLYGLVKNNCMSWSFLSVAHHADPDDVSKSQAAFEETINATYLIPTGTACGAGDVCASGFCVDGVCCDSACGGGASSDCQACSVAQGALADGTCAPLSGPACDDGDANTVGEVCSSGACVVPTSTPTLTSTNTPTSTPTPTLAAGCPHVPSNTCYSAGKSSVQLKSNADSSKQTFSWKWSKGVAQLGPADFGDPESGATTYALCVYDQTASSAVFKMGAAIAAGGTCDTKPCWKALSDKGWGYKNSTGNGNGIKSVQLKGGVAGKPQLKVQGKGSGLPFPSAHSSSELFDQDPAVLVQLYSNNPESCWSSTFDGSSTKKNDGVLFKAVTP